MIRFEFKKKYFSKNLILFQSGSIGEVMANKDGISSSTDSSKRIMEYRFHEPQNKDDDDISTLTLATDNKLSSICMFNRLI